MKLIAVYVVIVIAGLFIAYIAGRAVEMWSETASLPVFLALFFAAFFLGWKAAVRLTA
jgi:hypothetical protein